MILPATSATKGADNEDGCAITVRVTLVTVISQTFSDFRFSRVTVVTLKSKTFIGKGFFKNIYPRESYGNDHHDRHPEGLIPCLNTGFCA